MKKNSDLPEQSQNRKLKTLIIEDSPIDAELNARELVRQGYQVDWQRVKDAAGLKEAFSKDEWDVILSDHNIPGFGSRQALRILQESGLTIPFIIISGTIGEEAAVEILREGAHDYLLKDRLARLGSSVEQALAQIEEEKARQEAEAALQESEEKHRLLLENSGMGVGYYDLDGRVILFNQVAAGFMGGQPEDYVGKTFQEMYGKETGAIYQKRLKAAANSKKSLQYEDHVKLPASDKWFLTTYSRVMDASGEIRGVQIISADITDIKIAQEAILESERFARASLDGLSAHIAIVDEDGVILAVNQAWRDFSDANGPIRSLTYEGANYLEVCDSASGENSEEAKACAEAIRSVLSGKSQFEEIEYPCDSPDEKRFFIVRITPFPGEGSKRAVVAHENITSRKQAEEARRESEERFRVITSHTPDHIIIQNKKLFYTSVINPQLGLTEKDMVGKTDYDFLSPQEADKLTQIKRKVLETDQTTHYSTSLISTTGKKEYFDGTFVPKHDNQGKVDGLIGYFRNVTERLKAEETLRKNESLLNKIFDTLPVGLWLADSEGHLTRSNEAGRRIWGAEPLVPIEKYGVFKARRLPSGEAIAPDDWALAHSIKEGVTIVDELLEIDAFDGIKRTIYNYTAPVILEEGKIEGAVVVNLDITEQYKAEESLRLSEDRFRKAFESNPAAIAITRQSDGIILDVNENYLRLMELERDEAVGKSVETLGIYPDRDKRESIFRKLKEKGFVKDQEIAIRRKSGGLRDTLVSVEYITIGEDICRLSILRDITEQRKAEKALERQSEVDAALAELSRKLLEPNLEIEQVTRHILETAKTLTNSEVGYVTTIDQATGSCIAHTLTDMVEGACQVADKTITFDRGPDGHYPALWGFALNTRTPSYTNSPAEHPAAVGIPAGHVAVDNFLNYPILFSDDLLGNIAIGNKRGGYTEEDMAVVGRIATFYGLFLRQWAVKDALKKSEERFRLFYEQSPSPYQSLDVEGAILDINAAWLSTMGYKRDEVIGKWFGDFLTPQDRETFNKDFETLRREGKVSSIEREMVKKDGEIMTASFEAQVGYDDKRNFVRTHCVFTDITERKRVEDQIRANEARMRVLVEILQYQSNSIQDLLDYALNKAISLTGSRIGYIYHYDDQAEQFILNTWSKDVMKECRILEPQTCYELGKTGIWGEAVRQRQPIILNDYQESHRLKKGYPEGHVVLRRFMTVPIFKGDRIIAVVGLANKDNPYDNTDTLQLTLLMDAVFKVADQMKAESALLESEVRYRTLTETSPMGIWHVDPDGNTEYANPVMCEMLGYKGLEDLIGTSYRDFITPDTIDIMETERARRLEGVSSSYEVCLRARSGREYEVLVSGAPLYDTAKEYQGNLATFIDISELKRSQEQVEQLLDRQTTINQLTLALGDSSVLDEKYLTIYQKVSELMDTDFFVVASYDASQKLIRADVVVSNGEYLDVREFPPIPLEEEGKGTQSRVIYSEKPVYIPDLQAALRESKMAYFVDEKGDILAELPPDKEEEFVKSSLIVPMKIGGEVVGLMQVQSFKADAYTADDMELLTGLANVAAIAIQNARLLTDLDSYNKQLAESVEERTAELRDVKERVEAILNNSPDATLLLSAYGNIQVINPAFTTHFGYDIEDVFNTPITELCDPTQRKALYKAVHDVADQKGWRYQEINAQRKDGTTFDAAVALSPIAKIGGSLGMVCSIRDITALKEVERMKDTFVSNVSHELRTPITGLVLNHQLLLLNPEKRDVYLARLGREIERLRLLIEDLLRLSRLEQEGAALKLEMSDLNVLVMGFVGDRIPLARERELKLRYEEEMTLPRIMMDKGLLEQVLSILLTNAMNYTPAGGEIFVYTSQKEENDRQYIGFGVQDTGPGIPEEELPQLFTRFHRGKVGRESGVPGTGLGLNIAQVIISKHNGMIDVSNREDGKQGARFTVWLPVEEG